MEKINAIKGGTEVQVNDKGDTIVCNFGSQEFYADFTELIDNLEKVKKYVAAEEFMRKPEIEQLRIMIGKTNEIMSDIDRVFGERTCKKVFGEITPSPILITDFFDQIIPIARRYANGRNKELWEKYSRERKGGNINHNRNRQNRRHHK